MTLPRLAARLATVTLGAALLAKSRAGTREARAEADYPPSGQFAEVDGLRLHHEVAGEGPDLVMIHGASGSLRDLNFRLRDRLARDFRVILVDRPGLGHSDAIDAPGLRPQVDFLRRGLAPLGLANPILLGQSYGGAVALNWALQGGVKALVLVGAPSLPWPGKLDPWYRLTATRIGQRVAIPLASAFVPASYVARTTAAIFAPDPVPEGYAAHIGADLYLRRKTLAVNTGQVNALRDELVAMEPHYPTLSLPVELIHGSEDRIVPLDVHSGPLSRRLPDARLTVIPGAGHMPHHAHMQTVIDAVHRAALR